jgi:hypothetical protein
LFKKKRPVKFHLVGECFLPFEFASRELGADCSSMQKLNERAMKKWTCKPHTSNGNPKDEENGDSQDEDNDKIYWEIQTACMFARDHGISLPSSFCFVHAAFKCYLYMTNSMEPFRYEQDKAFRTVGPVVYS